MVRIAGFSGSGLPPVTAGGKKGQVIAEIKKLYAQMRDAAKVENYERAAMLRDKIRELAKDLGKSFN
jgi:protein-arginine kinase activator protein McsA